MDAEAHTHHQRSDSMTYDSPDRPLVLFPHGISAIGQSTSAEPLCNLLDRKNEGAATVEELAGPAERESVSPTRQQNPWRRVKVIVPTNVSTRRPSERLSVSDDDVLLTELCERVEVLFEEGGPEIARLFTTAAKQPPITNQALAELEIPSIVANAKLRHDINFDRELHFRPNFAGVKGVQKMQAAEEYWIALTAELELYASLLTEIGPSPRDGVPREALLKASQRRIPKTFETIKDILNNLVPERDRYGVNEQLDVQMLMQQIERGVCDLVGMARWISSLLKAHCAPMRDEWVDKMVLQIERGVAYSTGSAIVAGLKELFGILEAMKLDVANHQIRHLRVLLVDDAIGFETDHHLDRIKQGFVNIKRSQAWFFQQEQFFLATIPKLRRRDRWQAQAEVFMRALVRHLMSPRRDDPFVETMYLDSERIRTLQVEVCDHVYAEVCFEVFEFLATQLGRARSDCHLVKDTLRKNLSAIVGESSQYATRPWTQKLENIAVELVRQALATSGSSKVWDGRLLQQAERLLCYAFTERYYTHARTTEDDLARLVMKITEAQLNVSPLDLFNELTEPLEDHAPKLPDTLMSSENVYSHRRQTGPLTTIARRTAHIGILHWRVMGPIAYLSDENSPHWSDSHRNTSHELVRSTEDACWSSPDNSEAHMPSP